MAENVPTRVEIDGGVLVGDDGSASAGRALRYALEDARRRGAPLHVVRAFSITSAERPADAPHGYAPSLVELAAATKQATEDRVRRLVGEVGDVTIEVHVPYGPAAQCLIDASAHADVVVVGARGRGGFATLLLGSVADQVIRHADAPVVVVRK